MKSGIQYIDQDFTEKTYLATNPLYYQLLEQLKDIMLPQIIQHAPTLQPKKEITQNPQSLVERSSNVMGQEGSTLGLFSPPRVHRVFSSDRG